ncbi:MULTISPECIES: helix-turn-helix transcriptional regulator [Mesorhizobium]|uniref:Helix-turn-helix transcriptional regulator n=1 Tax=Mesorhizobium abyssinicae TaxID=1209958 RepID=A0ABU5AI97_9HYPH|nr:MULTISPECIES: helix-turn-helix transcriptional regulator [Mesorhizobium]MDX8435891.1 helix-turn-helix transcriptional regulator [Mesorhizobium abyssinicae]MDX8536976.1 helix-turn-helix transcriptional regulator [Mesorhizobium abyssinicae]RUW28226.1 helix-turn-helix transcriptional regulator [Mesorhizobium sp. M4B.F.Ca.ET.013.02.1.1]RUW70379.1 helix-turn-helix transcriptional regulator [Mesorhizobium sp. M4B.F.Ca.ET.049.02.1.2]RVD20891.1 helix-turn-helix transcriptional regulator [Mesorhizob
MLSHDRVWAAIDALAERYSLSASGLARRAGLDSTAFNKSKRLSSDGRPRWPSTESLAKIIEATGASLEEFTGLVEGLGGTASQPRRSSVPLLGFAQAGAGGFFDDAGYPAGQGWDLVELPARATATSYALKVQGDSMLPLYRNGDVLIVEPGAATRKGDRVVVKTAAGEVMAKVLDRQTAKSILLVSLNPDHPDRDIPMRDVEWVARIVWASQ